MITQAACVSSFESGWWLWSIQQKSSQPIILLYGGKKQMIYDHVFFNIDMFLTYIYLFIYLFILLYWLRVSKCMAPKSSRHLNPQAVAGTGAAWHSPGGHRTGNWLLTEKHISRVPVYGISSGFMVDIGRYNYWLVVLTILKNIGQWEGVSHILWKIPKCLKPPTRLYNVWGF